MNKIVFNIDPYTFTGSAAVIGLALVNELPPLEQDSVGNWLQLVGLTMQTYQSQQAVIDSDKEESESKSVADDIENLKKVISKMEKELNNISSSCTPNHDN